MPEKLTHSWSEILETVKMVFIFSIVGITIGVGQLMASKEKLTPQIVVGRALSTGGLAMASGMVLVWIPDLPLIGQIGVAAALASLGTSGIERVLQRFLFGAGESKG